MELGLNLLNTLITVLPILKFDVTVLNWVNVIFNL